MKRKFRAWDKQNREMLYDSLEFELRELGYGNTIECHPKCKENDSFIGFLADCPKWVMMQYIGAEDKNGKEIYEGDVARFRYYQSYVVGVVGALTPYGVMIGSHFYTNIRQKDTIEVIGNICEHSELLKRTYPPEKAR